MNKISFRNSAKAVIVKDGKVLLLQKQYPGMVTFTVFPGGGQEADELLNDAVARECLEEIGATVQVGKLLFVREYRSWMEEFHNPDKWHHQLEFFFKCELLAPLKLENANNPDPLQIGFSWVALDALEEANLYPKVLRKLLPERLLSPDGKTMPVYLGGVN